MGQRSSEGSEEFPPAHNGRWAYLVVPAIGMLREQDTMMESYFIGSYPVSSFRLVIRLEQGMEERVYMGSHSRMRCMVV